MTNINPKYRCDFLQLYSILNDNNLEYNSNNFLNKHYPQLQTYDFNNN